MTAAAPKLRKGRKFDQVIEGARDVFMAHGFDGAGVDEIARAAGVSKATLYSYFPDKRVLFSEVAARECLRQADAALASIDLTAPPARVLDAVARRIIAFFASDFGQAMFRLCVAETARFPELGRRFYESGPLMARAKLGDYLRAAAARGELCIDDVDLAADQFAHLCHADLHDRLLCGVQTRFSQPEIDRVVKGAVRMFLAAYGRGAPVQGASSATAAPTP
ncbi:MAG: TetR/AcrR family transcriptional regulator [Rhodobacteraceae bacterium]|nr:TetR/AcrR family transcriptional regulator [Paracoccaceae bacterium]